MARDTRKIAIVSPFPPPYGGISVQAEKLCHLLAESGFHVIEIRTNVQIPRYLTFVSRIKGVRTLLRSFFFINDLRKALHKVDTVYILTGFFNFFFWVTYPALLLITLNNKKLVLSAHGGGAKQFFQKYGSLVRSILKKVDVITVPSNFLQDVFGEALGIETKVVPNIIDLSQFRFRIRYPVRSRLLVARNLEPLYNVSCVIRAFKKVHEHFPESALGIAGDGSERLYLERLVAELGLRDCVAFHGSVEHQKMQSIFDQYDILVNASNIDNLPTVILEAFACGLVVVSTKPGGIPYMVDDGVTGMLVSIGDCAALAEKIIHLVQNPDIALTLTQNAKTECDNYSAEHVRALLLPILENPYRKQSSLCRR